VHILIVGAGGLGCEILKNCCLMGFRHIDIIDMDVIELTNLNRQFLFREKDIGRYKAEVAAEAVRARVKDLQIGWFKESIQEALERDPKFYNKYMAIVAGLDNEQARLWLNRLVHNLYNQGKTAFKNLKITHKIQNHIFPSYIPL
jgi:ubiquitin-activating enzyme E1 C